MWPTCFIAFLPGDQATGPGLIAPSLEGREQSWHSGHSTRAASAAHQQRFPHSAAAMELGSKGTGGMSSLIHEQHLGQLPAWSCGRNDQQEQPGAVVRRVLGSSCHLRAPAGHLLLAVCGDSVPRHCGDVPRHSGDGQGSGEQLPVALGTLGHARTASEHGLGRDCLTPEPCFPPLLCPPAVPHSLPCLHQKELGKTSAEPPGIGPAHGRQRWGVCTSSAHDFPTQESTREHRACPQILAIARVTPCSSKTPH